jgi:DNA-binding transcriptional regulator YhcF (GntR family)
MVQFFVDKSNKVPLYLQLQDQIKYYISTGALAAEERLPPVKALAASLGINFQTVRKAYQELADSGLVNVKHGEGTFISLTNSPHPPARPAGRAEKATPADARAQFAEAVRQLVKRHVEMGLEPADAKAVMDEAGAEIERAGVLPVVVFAECNTFQIREISGILEGELKLPVKPMLVADVAASLPALLAEGRGVNIVTTGFHVNEVRQAVGERPVQIDVLITNLNPETRRQLEAVGEQGRYSFICRDQESAVLYKDLLKAELGYRQMQLTSCTLAETEKVRNILNSTDVVLVSPPVYEAVRRMAPPKKAVYNVFERVDPMSLKVVKDRILG